MTYQLPEQINAKVSKYKTGGFYIASAEGPGISRSKESLEEGGRLSEISRERLRKLAER